MAAKSWVIWLLSLLPALVACPPPPSAPGDVTIGTFDVQAKQVSDDCDLGTAVRGGDFSFRASFSGDTGGDRVYLVVAVPPGYAEQPPVSGVVEDGKMVFTGSSFMTLETCGCAPLVEERFVFEPLLVRTDGGAGGGSDGGAGDTDGGAGGADGGSVPDAGGETSEDGPIPGLPDPREIVGLGGTLTYGVSTAADCRSPESDAGRSCALPCTIAYSLSGTLR